MTRVSLCMIVRDEAAFIGACLDSVRGVVDEIIVVDTGSTDETVAIAVAHGARVVVHPWQDNFSAARNAALPLATGQWVLILDADERLAPHAGEVLRTAVEVGGFDCGLLPLFDARDLESRPEDLSEFPERFQTPIFLHRLFIRDEGLRWKNRIHEAVVWLEEPTRRSRYIEAPIVHYGNVPALRAQRDKDARNFKLLEQTWREEPENLIMTAIYLADLFRIRRDDEVRNLAQATWRKLVTNFAGEHPIRHPRFLNVVTITMWFLIQERDYHQALAIQDRAGRWGIDHPNLIWMGATCLENLAYASFGESREQLLKQGLAQYHQLCRRHGQPYTSEVNSGITSWQAWLSLGRIHLRLGEPLEAQVYFERALPHLTDRDRTTASIGLIECSLDCGDTRRAMRLIRKARGIAVTDLVVLRAEAYEQSNNIKACFDQIRRLMGDVQPQFSQWSVEHRFQELVCLLKLYQQQPIPGAGPMGRLGAVLSGASLEGLADVCADDRLNRLLVHLVPAAGKAFFAPFFKQTTQRALPLLSGVICAHFDTPSKPTQETP